MSGELVETENGNVGRSDDALQLCSDEEGMCTRVKGRWEKGKNGCGSARFMQPILCCYPLTHRNMYVHAYV